MPVSAKLSSLVKEGFNKYNTSAKGWSYLFSTDDKKKFEIIACWKELVLQLDNINLSDERVWLSLFGTLCTTGFSNNNFLYLLSEMAGEYVIEYPDFFSQFDKLIPITDEAVSQNNEILVKAIGDLNSNLRQVVLREKEEKKENEVLKAKLAAAEAELLKKQQALDSLSSKNNKLCRALDVVSSIRQEETVDNKVAEEVKKIIEAPIAKVSSPPPPPPPPTIMTKGSAPPPPPPPPPPPMAKAPLAQPVAQRKEHNKIERSSSNTVAPIPGGREALFEQIRAGKVQLRNTKTTPPPVAQKPKPLNPLQQALQNRAKSLKGVESDDSDSEDNEVKQKPKYAKN